MRKRGRRGNGVQLNFPHTNQDIDEFDEFLRILERIAPLSILEIGVYYGGTLARFKHHFPNAKVIGIDPEPLIEPKPKRVLRGKSQDPQIREQALAKNGGRKYDVVFIDGDHNYQPALDDWEWARDHAASIVVAFHDIKASDVGCRAVWDQIVASNDFDVEVISRHPGHYGIGLVWL